MGRGLVSWIDTLREKFADEDFRRNLKRGLIAAAVVGSGLYVYSKGRKHGYSRGFTAGYGEARTEEALALEAHEE